MKVKRLLMLIGSICLILMLLVPMVACAKEAPAPAPAAEVIKWKFQTYAPSGDLKCESDARLVKTINETSGGRLEIEFFDAGAIVPATKEVDAVARGALDMSCDCFGYEVDKWKTAGLFSTRSGGLDAVGMRIWFDQKGGLELANQMTEEFGVTILRGPYCAPPEVWAMSTVPINSLADIKGLRMRCMGDAGEMLDKMGMSVIFLPGGEIYESVQRGVLDAFEYSSPMVNYDMAFYEICKYWIMSNTRYPTDVLPYWVNTESWEKLPTGLKNLVQSEAEAETWNLYSYVSAVTVESVEKVQDYGCIFSHLPEDVEAAFLKIAKDFYDERAAGDPFYAKVLESQCQFQKEYAGYDSLIAPIATLK